MKNTVNNQHDLRRILDELSVIAVRQQEESEPLRTLTYIYNAIVRIEKKIP